MNPIIKIRIVFLCCLFGYSTISFSQESKIGWGAFTYFGLDIDNGSSIYYRNSRLNAPSENEINVEVGGGAFIPLSKTLKLRIGFEHPGTKRSWGGYLFSQTIDEDGQIDYYEYNHSFKLSTNAIFVGVSKEIWGINFIADYYLTRTALKEGNVIGFENQNSFTSQRELYPATYSSLFYTRLGFTINYDFIKKEKGSFGLYLKIVRALGDDQRFDVLSLDPEIEDILTTGNALSEYNAFTSNVRFYQLESFSSFGVKFNYFFYDQEFE